MDLIRIAKAQLAFGSHPILDNADAVIESGERVCIVGRNGAGKSTTTTTKTVVHPRYRLSRQWLWERRAVVGRTDSLRPDQGCADLPKTYKASDAKDGQ